MFSTTASGGNLRNLYRSRYTFWRISMTQRINHQWRLAARPIGNLTEADFQWAEEPVPELKEGQVLVRNLYLSLDPANRGWVREEGSYMAPIPLGAVMLGITVGVVEESRNA